MKVKDYIDNLTQQIAELASKGPELDIIFWDDGRLTTEPLIPSFRLIEYKIEESDYVHEVVPNKGFGTPAIVVE